MSSTHWSNRFSPYGIAVLRLAVGGIFLAHGAQKAFIMGVGGVAGFFTQLGIPLATVAAPMITGLELLGGVALIAGLGTRWVAIPLALDVLTATLLVHLRNGIFVQNGGYELTMLLGAACIALIGTGPGALAIDNRFQRSTTSGAVQQTVNV